MYLSVRIAVGEDGPSVRAIGGEDGDGREPGDENENAVTGATLFLFRPEADLNTEAGRQEQILATYYYGTDGTGERKLSWNGDEDHPVYTTSLENVADLEQITGSCKVLAVVNSDYTGKGWTTLGDIRDAVTSDDLWMNAADEGNIRKTHFLMSSTDLGTVTGIDQSDAEHPATGVVSVERLAARVDYRTDPQTAPQGVFSVTDGENTEVGEVTLLGAAIVNQAEGSVNLLKHVAADYTEDVAAATVGRETPQAGLATNWVIDALATTGKTFSSPLSTFTAETGWESRFSTGMTMVNSTDNTSWNCLGYIRENVNRIQSAAERRRYATGVVFRAQYDVTAEGFTDGQDLYKYGTTLYPSLAAACEAAGVDGTEVTAENYAEYGITYYPGGICYYTYWIKHADDGNGETFGTMEYAIVRNNLYQLTVTSVGSIGDPVPGDSELEIEVAVRDWVPLQSEDVDLQ